MLNILLSINIYIEIILNLTIILNFEYILENVKLYNSYILFCKILSK